MTPSGSLLLRQSHTANAMNFLSISFFAGLYGLTAAPGLSFNTGVDAEGFFRPADVFALAILISPQQ